MLRRVCQHTATVAFAATLASASASSSTHKWTGAKGLLCTPARGFITIKMTKSPNQGGEADTNQPSVSSSPTADEGAPDFDIQWDSKDFYKRLGLDKKCSDKDIRARYIELAKRFHPDLAASDNSYLKNLPPGVKIDDIFKNIKEAYEALSKPETRAYIDARGSEEYQERQQQGYGVSPEEYARQQAVRQVFTDGLPFFIASVFLFIGIMAYHYRARLNVGTLFYFFFILMVLGAFPRLLAAALMYMMHCNDMLTVYEAESQVGALVSVTARQAKTSHAAKKGSNEVPMEVTIRAEGLDKRHVPEGNMVVEIKRHQAVTTADAAPTTAPKEAEAKAEITELFVFPKGVTTVTLPLMLPAASGTVQAPTWDVHVRFINDALQLTLMDKVASL